MKYTTKELKRISAFVANTNSIQTRLNTIHPSAPAPAPTPAPAPAPSSIARYSWSGISNKLPPLNIDFSGNITPQTIVTCRLTMSFYWINASNVPVTTEYYLTLDIYPYRLLGAYNSGDPQSWMVSNNAYGNTQYNYTTGTDPSPYNYAPLGRFVWAWNNSSYSNQPYPICWATNGTDYTLTLQMGDVSQIGVSFVGLVGLEVVNVTANAGNVQTTLSTSGAWNTNTSITF